MTIEPTIEPGSAGKEVWDVLVVGAGPAGAAAAAQLAMRGVRVLLVDRAGFPRPKVCGCCLNARSLMALRSLGLPDLEALGGIRQRSIGIACGNKKATLPLPDTLSVSRERLDAALVRRAMACGAAFLPETGAKLESIDADQARVRLQTCGADQPVRARTVLAADGLAGRFAGTALGGYVERAASRIGAGAVIERRVFDQSLENGILMVCGPQGYVGLAGVENGKMAIAAALDAESLREKGAAAAVEAIFHYCHVRPPHGLAEIEFRGTPRLTRRPARVAARRVFALGDAAGYIEPFTGEGMAWAFAAAEAIAPLAQRAAENWSDDLVARWEMLHGSIVRRRQGICRCLAWTLRRPGLTQCAIAVAGVAPALANRLIAGTNRRGIAPMESLAP